MRVRVAPVELQQDGRGSVFEPRDPEGLPRQRHVHVVVAELGCVRGNHYHGFCRNFSSRRFEV